MAVPATSPAASPSAPLLLSITKPQYFALILQGFLFGRCDTALRFVSKASRGRPAVTPLLNLRSKQTGLNQEPDHAPGPGIRRLILAVEPYVGSERLLVLRLQARHCGARALVPLFVDAFRVSPHARVERGVDEHFEVVRDQAARLLAIDAQVVTERPIPQRFPPPRVAINLE